MSENLPAVIEPLEKPVEVNVSIPVPVVTDEQAVRALRRQGGVTFRADFLRDLSKLGIHSNGAGILRTTDGMAILTQAQTYRMAQEISIMAEKVPKDGTTRRKKEVTLEMVEKMSSLARAHSLLMGKINESLAIVRSRYAASEAPGPAWNDGANGNGNRVPSFPEGGKGGSSKTMIVAQHVHMDGAGAPEEPAPAEH